MTLKELQKKVKRKMSLKAKQELIAELRAEILRICPWTYDPAEDAERARAMKLSREDRMKQLKEKHGKVTVIPGREFDKNKIEELEKKEGIVLVTEPDYPENDLSIFNDQDLTKEELLENLGCMIMQELFPLNVRLQMLNAHEVFRREIKEAKEKGLPEPYKNLGGFHRVEPERDKLERCFGICEYQNRRF